MLRRPSIFSPAPLMEVRQSGLRVRRQASMLQAGLLRVAQEITVRGRQRTVEVSGLFCVFGLVRILKGTVRYRTSEQSIAPPGRHFGMFLPPGSLVEVELVGSGTFSVGFLLRDAFPQMPEDPVVFRLPSLRLPNSRAQLRALLAKGSRFRAIARQDHPSPAAAQLKRAIDRSYAQPLGLAQIVRSLGRSPAAASRAFGKAYGLTPTLYRHSLRVLESMWRLAQGEAIVDVSGEVGFGDLSRFYSHFRRIACAPPGRYRMKGQNPPRRPTLNPLT